MKLALFGQWNGASGLFYTFPEKLAELPEWAVSIPDPREVRELFNGNYCYSLWYNQNGYYYACTKTNTDSRNGCVMLALLAEKNVPKDGTLLAEKMHEMLDYCLSMPTVSDISYVDISMKMKEIEGLMTFRQLPPDASIAPEKGVAYRVCHSKEELKRFLENPNQPSYVGFKRVLAFDGSEFVVGSAHVQSLTQISDAILRTYDIRSDSNEVVPIKESVMEGEMYGVTYRKTGYADVYVELAAGRPNAYSIVDGNVIKLKSASDAGIKFKSEFVIQVFDSETNSVVKNWSCKVDGSYKGTEIKENPDGSVCLLLDPDKLHKIVISADGYHDTTVEVAAGEHGTKQVRLQSMDDSVFVSLHMGGQLYNGSVRMKSNNGLYAPLKKLEKWQMALQVKRPFFSRRNLWPIVGLFMSTLLIGGLLGWLIFGGKGNKPVESGEEMAQLRKESVKLQADIDSIKKENASYRELFPLYGKTLALVKEKIGVNSEAVAEFIGKEDYVILRDGKIEKTEDAKAILMNLNNELQGVTAVRQVGGVTKTATEEEKKAEDLKYFADNKDVWDLSKIQSDKFKRFKDYIINADILNLKAYTGVGNSGNYYNNENWKKICTKLKSFWDSNPTAEQKDIVQDAIKAQISNNKFNLKALAESETLKNY